MLDYHMRKVVNSIASAIRYSRQNRRTVLPAAAAVALLLFLALWLYGTCESRRLVVARFEAVVPKLPKAHDGLKIVVLADLHLCRSMLRDGFIDRLTAAVEREKPDLIFLLGDYVHLRGPFEMPAFAEISRIFAKFKAGHGVYAVTGNHDTRFMDVGLRQALRDGGVMLLENQGVKRVINGEIFQIAGVNDLTTAGSNPGRACRKLDKSRPIMMLAHNPMFFDNSRNLKDAAVTFAGHLHGGQIRLPLIGARYTPARLIGYLEPGFYPAWGEARKMLLVTSGVGSSTLPVRLLCPPEIVVLTLRGLPGAK